MKRNSGRARSGLERGRSAAVFDNLSDQSKNSPQDKILPVQLKIIYLTRVFFCYNGLEMLGRQGLSGGETARKDASGGERAWESPKSYPIG